jgi:CheY-like chemotaxis protein
MSSARATVLNVDGDDAHRSATTQILRKAGLPVCEVATGSEALSRAAGETGFHDHLVKPVEPAVLKELLARLRPGDRPRRQGEARASRALWNADRCGETRPQ